MSEVQAIIERIAISRRLLLSVVGNLSPERGVRKPWHEVWSAAEILEHLVLAEMSGVTKDWQAAESLKAGKPVFIGENANRGLTIEKIVDRTWRPKETAPPIATPHMGGPLAYWVATFESCQPTLERLGASLEGASLSDIIFPHFLCGPLDARQRLEFLRFHIDRHRVQIQNLLTD